MTSITHNYRYTYKAYGLYLRSNQPVPNLMQVAEQTILNSDDYFARPVQITFAGVHPWGPICADWRNLYKSPGQTLSSHPFLEIWQHEAGLHLRHSNTSGENGTEASVDFSIGIHGSTVDITWTPAMSFQDIVAYFVGPVLGCVLRLRDITCLHAAVIKIEQRAIAIIGPKGAGKSTTAAFFVQQGCALLTDDIAPLASRDGQFWVQPGYPCLRLWPNTIDALADAPMDNLAPVLSFAEKRYFPLASKDEDVGWRQFEPTPLPLVAIYVLDRFDDNDSPLLLPIPQAIGLVTLVRNTYADYVLSETGRSHDFKVFGQLASEIPLKQVKRPENLEALPELYRTILADCRKLHDFAA